MTVPVGLSPPLTVAWSAMEVPTVALAGCWLVLIDGAGLTTRSPVPVLDLSLIFPAKNATTPPVSVPAASEVGTPDSVATPLLFVSATPANAPSRVNDTGTFASDCPLAEVTIAVKVAFPPTDAVPETPVRTDNSRWSVRWGGKPWAVATERATTPLGPKIPVESRIAASKALIALVIRVAASELLLSLAIALPVLIRLATAWSTVLENLG